MERIEEVPHIRLLFSRYDAAQKIKLVEDIRRIAIDYLQPVTQKLVRPMSDEIRAAYQAKGISLEWNLTTTDAYEFCGLARIASLTPSQHSAANLLNYCTQAIEMDAIQSNCKAGYWMPTRGSTLMI